MAELTGTGWTMSVALVTVVLEVVFVMTAIGWRTVQQRRTTGSSGFVAMRERGLGARVAALLLVASLVLLAAGPGRQLIAGEGAAWSPAAAVGVLAMLAGLALTLVAQQHMGTSWRVGVDPQERSKLVTAGVFGRVRNPIFSAMMLFGVGVALACGDVVSGLGAAALVAGIVMQVRVVEEPYLAAVHGASYAAYWSRAGRFLPRLRRGGSSERAVTA